MAFRSRLEAKVLALAIILFCSVLHATAQLGLCLDRISGSPVLNMQFHPANSSRAFLATQDGRISIADIPSDGSGQVIRETSTFLDLTSKINHGGEFGLLGFALHPNFTSNGRFFVSYTCDSQVQSGCTATCACSPTTGCSPGDLGSDGCRNATIVAEYRASPPSSAKASPTQVKRILSMGLPYEDNHGGQILFGPEDGYLYVVYGDGGGSMALQSGDPWNFAQKKTSLLGKVLRIDVDASTPAEAGSSRRWGSYGIPKDNPFVGQRGVQPEIYALGFRNPWRCFFDSAGSHRLFCGDSREEEVDIVVKGGNYGWRLLEGNLAYTPAVAPGGSTTRAAIRAIPPIAVYNHTGPFAAVTGGVVSHSPSYPCLEGKYLFVDLFGSDLFVSTESTTTPANTSSSGGGASWQTERMSMQCASSSAIRCRGLADNIFWWGWAQGPPAARGNAFMLSSSGVYRLTDRSRCNKTCTGAALALNGSSSDGPAPSPGDSPAPPPKGAGRRLSAGAVLAALASLLCSAAVLPLPCAPRILR
eukprot:jgi/Mesen1/6541/ME000334S05875